MMKHGTWAFALWCGLAVAGFAAETEPRGWHELTPEELEAVEGGDLLLSVDRDKQMMTVTRITPGNYDNIQCFTVKVTTSVVRGKDLSPTNPKGAMENTVRRVDSGKDVVLAKQFPSGTATISPTPTTKKDVQGPVLTTSATQMVTTVDQTTTPIGQKADAGYNVHYVDPATGSNTLGCVGVQSQEGMAKIIEAQRVDNASYATGQVPQQTITVSDYTQGIPPESTFHATESKKSNVRTQIAL